MAVLADTRTSWLRAIRGFNRNAYLLFFASGVLGFSYLGITSLLSNLFVTRLGYGTDVVGNLNALFYLLHMAASVPAGAIGVRLGSRRCLIIGAVVAIAGWGLAPAGLFLLSADTRMAALVTSRVVSSVGGALFIVNSGPALMGAVDARLSTYAFSFNAMVVALMTFLGSLCGGFLPPLFSLFAGGSSSAAAPYGYALWAAVVVLLPGLVAIVLFRESGRDETGMEDRVRVGAPFAVIAVIAGVRVLAECGYGGVLVFFNIYLDSALRIPTSLIGVLVSVSSIATILLTPLTPLAARRWGNGITSLSAMLVMSLSVLLIAFSRTWLPVAVGWAAVTAANAINEAAMQVYILSIVMPHWRALMSGAANMATTLGFAVSAFGGGYLIGIAGYPALFWISASLIFAAATAFGTHLAFRRRRLA